jgi:hypothetical protein
MTPDNRIAFTDQAMLLGQQATGQESAIQGVWIYEHPIDMEAVRRFHRDYGHGLLGRRIETSPVPFGRHRWVSCAGPQAPLDIVETPRPRAELADWVDLRSQLPLDPERGPGWHMGVLPMTDGSTAVSLVVSHCLADGGGVFYRVVQTVFGDVGDLDYPPPHSRTRTQAIRADLAASVRELRQTGRALRAVGRQVFRRRHEVSGPAAPATVANRSAGPDRTVALPGVSVWIDGGVWDERTKDLGGNAHSMLAGFAARLSQRLGRVRASDGKVTLNIPIADRSEGDDRANAVMLLNVSVDPAGVAKDQSELRTAIRDSLNEAREAPDEALEFAPLTPFIPKVAVRRGADMLFGFSTDLPVSCSNMGDVPPAILCVDGTPAEYGMLRGVDRHVTEGFLEQRGGLLTVIGGRSGENMAVSVMAWRPGGENTRAQLRELVGEVMADFELTGDFV